MKCQLCQDDKLSKEFPNEAATKECEHPALTCLQCVIDRMSKHSSAVPCPYNGCKQTVTDAAALLQRCRDALDDLYPPVGVEDDVQNYQMELSAASAVVNIVTMTGDMTSVKFNTNMTIEELKKEVHCRLKVEPAKQQLIYNNTQLETISPTGEVMRFKSYGIKPFSTIHLMVLLYAIPEHFNHVVFDLFWGYPAHGADYLDASCLVYSGKQFQYHVDYRNLHVGSSIHHSGDVMDHAKRLGHHTIEVRLKDLPSSVDQLFFTLSAWTSPTISHFPNPSLKFYEASNRNKDLCKTSFQHARNSQAVIMCSVSRRGGGHWSIIDGGTLSAGNAKNYAPLKAAVLSLIK